MPAAQVAVAEADEGTAEVLLKPSQNSVGFRANNGSNAASTYMLEEVPSFVLETPAEKRARHCSLYILYITTFVMSIGFSIVLTGVWPYLLQLDPNVSKEFLGWVIAANPVGQMLTSPLLGLWGNKAGSIRGAFLFTMAIFTIGNGIYAILSVFGSASRAVMIISRFLVGVSSANIAIIRSYISSSTTIKERTNAVALTSAAQALGFIIGPAIQTALAVAFAHESSNPSNSTLPENMTVEEVDMEKIRVEWNMYTATGWIGAVLGVLNFFLFLPCVFQEHSIAAKEAQLQKQAAQDDNTELPKPDYIALIGVLFSFFIFLFIYVLLETLLVPMCIDMYAWSNEKAITVVGIGISLAGVLAVVMFALTSVLTKRFNERKILIFLGMIPMTLGMLLHFPVGSTYPKMKNCTTDPFHYEEFDYATTLGPFSFDLPLTTLPEVNMSEKDRNSSEIFLGDININNKEKLLLMPLPEQMTTSDRDVDPLTTLLGEMSTTGIEVQSSTILPEETNTISELELLSILPEDSRTSDEEKPSTVLMEGTNNIDEMMPSTTIPGAVNLIDSEFMTVTRRRRHIVREGMCHALGCPQEQEWCLYTPIIELPQMAVAGFVTIIGYPVGITIANSLFSKLLGPKPQGVWMGILTSAGSLSRVAGPIFVSYLYTAMGTRWTFGVLFVVMFFTSCVVIYLYKRLVPMKIIMNI